MSDISQIKLPNNTTYDIRDAKKSGVYAVKGTQTAITGSWTGNINIPALYDGLSIDYFLPYKGSGNATLNLTLSDGTTTGAVACYLNPSKRLQTQHPAGSTIHMTYWSAGSISISGTPTTSDQWICDAAYDTNSNTWRNIQVNGTQILGTGTGTGALNLEAGTEIALTNSSGTVTIDATTHTTVDGTTLEISNTTYSNDSVSQTDTSTNADYRVIFSASANDTTETSGVRKNGNLIYNPSTGYLTSYTTTTGSVGNGIKVLRPSNAASSVFSNMVVGTDSGAYILLTSNGLQGGLVMKSTGGSSEYLIHIFHDTNEIGFGAHMKKALGLKDLLWENSSPTSAFSTTTIPLNLSGYSEIQIDYRKSNSIGVYQSIIISIPHDRTAIYLPASNAQFHYRWTTVTTSSVKIEDGMLIASYAGTSGSTNNAINIPYRIWGWNPPHLTG